jgi:hypothetical protein
MIRDPFCVVAPHSETFDQQPVTKAVRLFESMVALLDGGMDSGTS